MVPGRNVQKLEETRHGDVDLVAVVPFSVVTRFCGCGHRD